MTITNPDKPIAIIQSSGAASYNFNFDTFPQPVTTVGSPNHYISVHVAEHPKDTSPLLLIQNTDYTLATVNQGSRRITFVPASVPPAGKLIFIYSDLPEIQPYDFKSAPVSPLEIQNAVDRAVMLIKQLQLDVQQAVRLKFPLGYLGYEMVVDATALVPDSFLTVTKPDPSKEEFVVSSAPTGLKDLQDLITQANLIKTTIDGLLATIQGIQTNVQALQSTASSAANNAQSALSSINSQVATLTALIPQFNKILADSQAALASTLAAKSDVESIKQSIDNTWTQIQQLVTTIQGFISKFPDPTGQPVNQMVVTNGLGGWKFEYPLLVENLGNAPVGSSVITATDTNGHPVLRASSAFVTNTKQVATVTPAYEGGTDTAQSLTTLLARIRRVEYNLNIRPWGEQEVITEFMVRQDASLISRVGGFVIYPTNAPNTIWVTTNGEVFYYSSSLYNIPDTIGSSTVFSNPSTIIIAFYPTSSATDTVLLSKNDLELKYIAQGSIEISSGAFTQSVAVPTGEPIIFAMSVNGTAVNGFVGKFSAGAITTTTFSATLPNAITPTGFIFSGSDNVRFTELILLKKILNQQDFQTFAEALFSVGTAATSNVPDPNNAPDGSVPVVNNGAYTLQMPFLFSNIPSGYTLTNQLDLSSATTTGTYVPVVQVDANTKTIKVIFMPETVQSRVTHPIISGLSHTAPVKILDENNDRCTAFISNRTDSTIYVGEQAALTTDRTNGIKIVSGAEGVVVPYISAIYAITESTTTDAVGSIFIEETVQQPKP